jgi:hypothetical protein
MTLADIPPPPRGIFHYIDPCIKHRRCKVPTLNDYVSNAGAPRKGSKFLYPMQSFRNPLKLLPSFENC